MAELTFVRRSASSAAVTDPGPLIWVICVILASACFWILPFVLQMGIGAVALGLIFLLVPLLWREGYTWVLLWLAPIAAFDPVPTEALRAVKYVLVAAALFIALLKRRGDPEAYSHPRDPVLWAGIGLLAWIWFRAIFGGSPLAGAAEAGRITLVAALIYMWLSEPARAGGRRRWFVLWMLMAMYQVTICFVEAAAFGHLRSFGTFPNANAMGTYFLLTIVPALAAAITARARSERVLLYIGVAALAAALYLTGSRAAWLSTTVGLIAVAIVARHWRLVALGLVGVAALMTLYATNPIARLATDAALRLQTGLTHRPLLWEAADRARDRAPVLGYGLEAAGEQMAAEARYPSPIHREIIGEMMARGSPHNLYRELQMETGAIGLILLGVVIGYVLRAAWRARRSKDRWRRVYGIAAFSTTLGVLVHAYFERSVFIGAMSSAVFYWLLVAQSLRPDDPVS